LNHQLENRRALVTDDGDKIASLVAWLAGPGYVIKTSFSIDGRGTA